MLTLNEVKTILDQYKIRPNKHLGQNFLIDSNIADEMLKRCRLANTEWILEIGPGLGALTSNLSNSVKKVIAVEKDRRFCFILNELLRNFVNVKIVCDDFLEMDLSRVLMEAPTKVKVIGNLPYYITTPIIEKLITNRNNFSSIFITVQKELAQRLCARPGNKVYGAVTCFVQFHTKPAILMDINRRAFYPQPEVDSVFMELAILPLPPVLVNDTERFFKIIRACFGQRRKTLLNSLFASEIFKLDKEGLAVLLTRINIDPNRRPEELSLEEFAKIENTLG